MTNYNDFDLDMQISQSQEGISPQSTGSIYSQWDCVTTKISEIACTSIATICWECETSDICSAALTVAAPANSKEPLAL